MPVECRNECRTVRCDLGLIKKWGGRLLEAVGFRKAQLSILLTTDERMAQLHERWMGLKGPTDVLSFSMLETKVVPEVLGDVAISLETAKRRCPRDPLREVKRLLIHGVLHLVGYDHLRVRDRQRMNRQALRLKHLMARPGESARERA